MDRECAEAMRFIGEQSDSLVALVGSDNFFELQVSPEVRKQVARQITV